MSDPFAAADALSSAAVSAFYGKRVRLIPWNPGGNWSEGGPDTTRPQADFTAIVSGAVGVQNLKGEAGGENFMGTIIVRDRRVTADNRDWPAHARQFDRILSLEEEGTPLYEIQSIVPDRINRTWANVVEIDP